MQKSPPKRILIPDGDSPLAVPVLHCLHQAEEAYEVFLLHADRVSMGPRSRFVHRVVRTARALDPEAILQAVTGNGIEVVLPVSTAGIRCISTMDDSLAVHVRLPALPSTRTMDLVGDKWELHRYLESIGLPTPRTFLLGDTSLPPSVDPEEPVLLKPRHGQGGVGIIRLDRASALEQRKDQDAFVQTGYIVQACVEGEHVDRSVYGAHGRIMAATMQRPLHRPGGYAPGKDLQFRMDHTVAAVVDGLLEKCGWSGVAHVDTIKDARTGTPYIVDVNPRYWATLLGSLAAGVNFPAIQVRDALGLPSLPAAMEEIPYLSFGKWPLHFLRHGTPLRHSSVPYNLADLRPKLHLWLHRKRILAMGR